MHLSHSAVVELTAKNLFRGSESSVSQLEIGPRTHARRHTQGHGWVVGWSVAHPPTRNMEVGGGECHPALFEGLSCLRLCSWLHSEEMLVQVVLCYQHSA